MSKNKRVLFVHHGIGLGGAPKSMAQLANRLKSDGVDIQVLYLKDSEAKQLLKGVEYNVAGLPLLYFNHSSRWYRWYEIHLIFLQLLSWFFTVFILAPYWLLKIKPDVVYLNSSVLTDWMLATKMLNIRNVLHVREAISRGHFGIRNKLIKMLLDSFSNDVIFLSEDNRKRLDLRKTNVTVVHNYVNEPVERIKIFYRIYDIIYVGGSNKIKGIDLVKNLLRDRNDLSFCLLGYYDDEFMNEFNDYNNVTLKGAVQNPLKYISRSKILLFPATTPHFPRPVIEALGCGAIPVVSDLDGIDEIITDGYDGLLFRNEDYSSLKEAIIRLDGINKEQMIKRGELTFNKKFSKKNENKILRLIMQNNLI